MRILPAAPIPAGEFPIKDLLLILITLPFKDPDKCKSSQLLSFEKQWLYLGTLTSDHLSSPDPLQGQKGPADVCNMRISACSVGCHITTAAPQTPGTCLEQRSHRASYALPKATHLGRLLLPHDNSWQKHNPYRHCGFDCGGRKREGQW